MQNFFVKLKTIYTNFYTKIRLEETKNFVRSYKKGKVLDLGAGTGTFNKIFRSIGLNEIFAVDFDKYALMINDADKKYLFNLENKLLFKKNYFDLVFTSEIIEHLNNRKQFLREVYRTLKPSGFVFLTTPNSDSLIAKFDRLIGRFMINGWWSGHNYNHKHVYSFKEIQKLVKDTGFNIVKSETFYLFYGIPIKTKTSLGMCTWILAQKKAKNFE